MSTTFAKPFQNIAISLSGGGYRATTFHLGALSYLNRIDLEGQTLFDRITTISTISGGTLTGVMVALYLAEGKTFEEAYAKLHELLTADELVEKAFDKLNNIDKWQDDSKTKNIINAFSEVYNEDFYQNATYKTLFESNQSHFKDLIFGSTEFTFGLQFRFQRHGDFGNYYLNLPKDIAQDIRLGDVAASSSCFPGGFEPMTMPTDYANSPNSALSNYWKNAQVTNLDENYPLTGIMDGGIIDNQGIEGVKLAERRRSREEKGPYTGTYLISDVSGKFPGSYEVPSFSRSTFKDIFTFKFINILVCVLTAGIITSLIAIEDEPRWMVVLSSVLLTLTVGWLLLFLFLKNKLLQTLKTTLGKRNQPDLFKDFSIFFKTPVYVLFYLVKVRALSLLHIVNSVFMRRIRRLQLKDLYTSDDWRYRVKTNNIYTLQGREYALDEGGRKDFKITKQMKAVIQTANDMPTTLWFTNEEQAANTLDQLIACGQFTMCRNLIRYIERLQRGKEESAWGELTDPEKAAILDLDNRLRKDFARFLEQPLWLVQEKNRV